jgi:hypothetical protein
VLTDDDMRRIEPVLDKRRQALRRHGRNTLDTEPYTEIGANFFPE